MSWHSFVNIHGRILGGLFLPFVMCAGCDFGRKIPASKLEVENGKNPIIATDARLRANSWVPFVSIAGSVGKTCTGILLSRTKVLTSAHCLWSGQSNSFAKPKDIEIVFNQTISRIYTAKSFSLHPHYVPGFNDSDMATIEISKPLDSRIAQYMPKFVVDTAKLKEIIKAKNFIFFGYGTHGILTYGMDVVIPFQLCEAQLRKVVHIPCGQSVNHICSTTSQGATNESKITNGDSGGPAFVYQDDTPLVIGIAVAFISTFSYFETFDRLDTKTWLDSQITQ